MKALCNSSEFSSIVTYASWNNSLNAFEVHASCSHYKRNYVIPEDKSLHKDIDPEIINAIRTAKWDTIEDRTSMSYDTNTGIVTYNRRTLPTLKIPIEEILADYKFI